MQPSRSPFHVVSRRAPRPGPPRVVSTLASALVAEAWRLAGQVHAGTKRPPTIASVHRRLPSQKRLRSQAEGRPLARPQAGNQAAARSSVARGIARAHQMMSISHRNRKGPAAWQRSCHAPIRCDAGKERRGYGKRRHGQEPSRHRFAGFGAGSRQPGVPLGRFDRSSRRWTGRGSVRE
jgi:hypothetical protein